MCLVDVLKGRVAHGRKNHMMFLRTRGASDRRFGLGVKGALAAHRRQKDRAGVLGTEKPHAGIDLARVDQPTDLDADLGVVLLIGTQRGISIYACGEVTEM